jgi:hypothetical protein
MKRWEKSGLGDVKIPHSVFVYEEIEDPIKNEEIKKERMKEAIKFFKKEKENKKLQALDKKSKPRVGDSKEGDLIDEEVKKERAKLALKRFREERDRKRNISKERALKLHALQKTAHDKLKKAIKYKFISKEQVQNMTESQLQKFELLGIKANEESFQLDVPQHIYDQEGIKDLSVDNQRKKERKRERKRKSSEIENLKREGNEELAGNAGGAEDIKAQEFLETEMRLNDKMVGGKKKHKFKNEGKEDDHRPHKHHNSLSRRQDFRVASYTIQVILMHCIRIIIEIIFFLYLKH